MSNMGRGGGGIGFGPLGMRMSDALRVSAQELGEGDVERRRELLRKLAPITMALGALESACAMEDGAFEDARQVAESALSTLSRLHPVAAQAGLSEAFAQAIAHGRAEAMLWIGAQGLPKAPPAQGPNAGPWTASSIAAARWPAGLGMMGWCALACESAKPASFAALEKLGLGQNDRAHLYRGLGAALGGLGDPLAMESLSLFHPWVALLCSSQAAADPDFERALAPWVPEDDSVWEALAFRACEEGSPAAFARLASAQWAPTPTALRSAAKAAVGILTIPEEERWEEAGAPALADLSSWLGAVASSGEDAMDRLVEDLREAIHQFPAYWAFDDAAGAARGLRRLAAWPSRPESHGWGSCPASRWEKLAQEIAVEVAGLEGASGNLSEGEAIKQLQALSREATLLGGLARSVPKRV